jgi:hypothetical protein
MSNPLPPPLAAYYEAKNRHDTDAMLAPFAEDAVVRDEGQEHRGRAAIRTWMEHTIRKYRVTALCRATSPALPPCCAMRSRCRDRRLRGWRLHDDRSHSVHR